MGGFAWGKGQRRLGETMSDIAWASGEVDVERETPHERHPWVVRLVGGDCDESAKGRIRRRKPRARVREKSGKAELAALTDQRVSVGMYS
jgi:hypothetical protein